jgi:hypothetical protein
MKNVLTILIIMASVALGEDIYIAQEKTGDGSGKDATNTRSSEWFNIRTNWRVSEGTNEKIGPSDTVHLVGKFDEGTKLVCQTDGLEGAPIVILFDPAEYPKELPRGLVDIKEFDNIVIRPKK